MSKCPWISMWTRPGKTIREIISKNPCKGMFLLALIFGIQYLLSLFYSLTEFGIFVETKLVLLSLLFSPVVGFSWFYVQGACLFFIGKFFKGKAHYIQMVASSAWSLVPTFITTVFWISFYLWVYLTSPVPNKYVESLMFLLPIVVNVWAAVLLIHCLKELQEYSYAKALGNFLLAALVFAFCVGMAVFAISYLVTFLFLSI